MERNDPHNAIEDTHFPERQTHVQESELPFEQDVFHESDLSVEPKEALQYQSDVSDYSIGYLLYEEEKGRYEEVELHSDRYRIGREASNDIIMKDDTVSRQHAVIYRKQNTYYIQNLSMTNPTQINGQEIKSVRDLLDNDQIQFGNVVMTFRRI